MRPPAAAFRAAGKGDAAAGRPGGDARPCAVAGQPAAPAAGRRRRRRRRRRGIAAAAYAQALPGPAQDWRTLFSRRSASPPASAAQPGHPAAVTNRDVRREVRPTQSRWKGQDALAATGRRLPRHRWPRPARGYRPARSSCSPDRSPTTAAPRQECGSGCSNGARVPPVRARGHRGDRPARRVQVVEPAPDESRDLPGGRARRRAQRDGADRARCGGTSASRLRRDLMERGRARHGLMMSRNHGTQATPPSWMAMHHPDDEEQRARRHPHPPQVALRRKRRTVGAQPGRRGATAPRRAGCQLTAADTGRSRAGRPAARRAHRESWPRTPSPGGR